MIHTYKIDGMTCNGCAKSVTQALKQIGEIKDVQIDLLNGEVQIEMHQHIGITHLQNALTEVGSYSISNPHKNTTSSQDSSHNLKRLFPLLLVFSYLLGLVLLTQLTEGWNAIKAMQIFMGGFFVAFSFFKFLDIKGFAHSFSNYDPISKRWLSYGYIYPFIELSLGIAYLTGINLFLTNIITLVVITIGTIGVAQALWQKRSIQCACLGTVFNLPMTQVTLTENSVMIVMAVGMLVQMM